MKEEAKPYAGKTCTCGIGPWSSGGECEHCGGLDLGLGWPLNSDPYIGPTGNTLRMFGGRVIVTFARKDKHS